MHLRKGWVEGHFFFFNGKYVVWILIERDQREGESKHTGRGAGSVSGIEGMCPELRWSK